jgi:hypothetical protein
MPKRRSHEPTHKTGPEAVRELAESLSGNYRKHCPEITGNAVQTFPKPAAMANIGGRQR